MNDAAPSSSDGNDNSEETQNDWIELRLGDRVVTILGTAHISRTSVDQVHQCIEQKQPAMVMVELDARRLEALENEHRFRNLDVVEVLKTKQTFLSLLLLYLAQYKNV